MEFPDLDFLGDNKVPVIAGGLVLVGVFVLGQMRGKSETPVQQTATLVPSEGVSWSDIIRRANQGVWGVVGPGEPVPGPKGDTGEPGTPGEPGTDTTVVVNADWLHINYAGRTGYVHASYVNGNKVNTPGSCLRFRTAADYNASVITCIPHGTTLTVLGSEAGKTPSSVTPPTNNVSGTQRDGYTWALITYAGKSGYAATDWLCGNRVCKTGGDGLRLRANPGLNAPVIMVIPEGGTVGRSQAGEVVNPNPGTKVLGIFGNPVPIASRRTVTVQNGDTLASMANRGYGSSKWWHFLSMMNPDKKDIVAGDVWNL